MTARQHRFAPAATESDDRLGALVALAALFMVLLALAAPALGS